MVFLPSYPYLPLGGMGPRSQASVMTSIRYMQFMQQCTPLQTSPQTLNRFHSETLLAAFLLRGACFLSSAQPSCFGVKIAKPCLCVLASDGARATPSPLACSPLPNSPCVCVLHLTPLNHHIKPEHTLPRSQHHDDTLIARISQSVDPDAAVPPRLLASG